MMPFACSKRQKGPRHSSARSSIVEPHLIGRTAIKALYSPVLLGGATLLLLGRCPPLLLDGWLPLLLDDSVLLLLGSWSLLMVDGSAPSSEMSLTDLVSSGACRPYWWTIRTSPGLKTLMAITNSVRCVNQAGWKSSGNSLNPGLVEGRDGLMV